MDLLRLALERAATAARRCDTIVALLDEFGQGGRAVSSDRGFTYHNSFIVADPPGRVRAGNGRPPPRRGRNPRGSQHLQRPDDSRLRPAAQRHDQDPRLRLPPAPRAHARLAERAGGPADLMRVLRDHGAGLPMPRYSWLNGGLSVPCVHAGGLRRRVANDRLVGGRSAPAGCRHWVTATAAPCTSLFKPVAVDVQLDLGPRPTDAFDGESLWWRHERLHRAVMRDPARLLARYAGERDAIEAAWLADPPESDVAFAEYDATLERWTADVLAYLGRDTRPFFVRHYWAKRNRRAGLTLEAESPSARSMIKA